MAASVGSAGAHQAPSWLIKDEERQARFIRSKIKEHFPDRYRDVLAIAECESAGLIHWGHDGSLLQNEKGESSAAGVLQVLLKLHRPDYEELNLNMEDIDDYLTFVRQLIERRGGYGDWAASEYCWGSKVASR